ncbi:S53 family peptidase [Roseateles amylovorans]|uniref:S53 family peptidase n=1 Tax=Roseateles amylovorans TaxID=2978473 RepID=A0ABY6B9N0_9BURK|nr:S53 family peptidase [Roseateles amylovorans]UXH79942.1 S53 family peptidase [Roseateles amylovorans]
MRQLAPAKTSHRSALWLCAVSAAALSACGGGQDTSADTAAAASTAASAPLVFKLAQPDATATVEGATVQAQPTFHAAPVILDEPADTDPANPSATALQAPHSQHIPAALAGLSTQRLSLDALLFAQRSRALASGNGQAAPQASGAAVTTYTPAQIRAAYGMPALLGAGATLTAAQAAALGAGQTVYIVNAKHNPNVAAELAAFNAKFGLPTCTTKAIATNTALPLAAASAKTCEFSQVYATPTGTLTATAPGYDSGWATEIALDVQWVHATAPLARLVLIEAVDASLNSLIGAIKLANAMGPGVVSMSFGANEGTYTAAYDSAFTGARMTYLAATGDSGVAVSWPSVSPYVVAVGGTTLSYNGTGARSEVAWSGTGGGVSAYTTKPSYQAANVPGFTGYARRTVADVAFNADSATGQYVAVMTPGSAAVNWMSVGGTSLSTPQWAGLIAIANAQRALSAKLPLGMPHAVLYGQIGAVPGNYASAFADITQGRHGSCSLCVAKTGYDELTGLGTPHVSSLLALLSGSTAPAAAPVAPSVSSATVSGQPGVALKYTVAVTAPNAVTYGLTGAPGGMSISTAGLISWASPVAGRYSVTVKATDTKTGLSGQGVLSVTIAKAGPVITFSPMKGVAAKALTGSFSITDATSTPTSIAITGVPAGMGFSISGLTVTAKWPRPVTGNYTLKVTVNDAAGLSSTVSIPVTITAK